MKTTARFFMLALLVVLSLTACQRKISVNEVPMHPDAKLIENNGFPVSMPWEAQDGKVSDGPYTDYEVEGPVYYYVSTENLDPDLDTFFKTNLTDQGWQRGEGSMYLNVMLGQFVTGLPWEKNGQVIFIAMAGHPVQPKTAILAVFVLTK